MRKVGTYIDKVDKIFVTAIHLRIEILVAWDPDLAPAVWHDNRAVILVEEHLASAAASQDRAGWDSLDLHHQGHVVLLVFAREERVTNIKLVQDAAEAPHVD